MGVALRLEHESSIEQDLARVRVKLLEPSPQLLVLLRVVGERVKSVEDGVDRLAVCEAFEKDAELGGGEL